MNLNKVLFIQVFKISQILPQIPPKNAKGKFVALDGSRVLY